MQPTAFYSHYPISFASNQPQTLGNPVSVGSRPDAALYTMPLGAPSISPMPHYLTTSRTPQIGDTGLFPNPVHMSSMPSSSNISLPHHIPTEDVTMLNTATGKLTIQHCWATGQ